MNNIIIFIIIISNIVWSEDKILWDLGVVIKNNQQTTNADESSDSGESNNSTESKTNNLNELPNTNSNTASANNEPKIIIEEHSN